MRDALSQMTTAASDRYAFLLDILRAQAESAMLENPTSPAVRDEAIALTRQVAATYLNSEQVHLSDDSEVVALAAQNQARADMSLAPTGLDADMRRFIAEAVLYSTRLLAAQAERDVTAVAQNLRIGSQRVDLYMRSGRHTLASALAQVKMDDHSSPAFTFADRAGRIYKSSKHLRDTYRHHLLNLYNEVYLDVAAAHGHDAIRVAHPDPKFKWAGATLALTGESDHPLYYDVREEIFHPSSEALLTLLETM